MTACVPNSVLEAFGLDPGLSDARVLGGGHIHDNFIVRSAGHDYVFQRINDHVFRDPGAVVRNGERVSRHLATKGWRVPELLRADERPFAIDGSSQASGEVARPVWRAWTYLPGTEGRQNVSSPQDSHRVGRIFGRFLASVDDLAPGDLEVTIPHFHDLERRLALLDAAVARAQSSKLREVRDELDRTRSLGSRIQAALAPLLPFLVHRVVHNDAKVANVRFDRVSGEAVSVVDYDTVMPGVVLTDVGELARSSATHAAEDAKDCSSVDFDEELMEALLDGYLSEAAFLLSAEEKEALIWAGPWMAIENAARFLTDHLEGDVYFRVVRPNQNLDRCRVQIRLGELMLGSFARTEEAIRRAGRDVRQDRPEIGRNRVTRQSEI